MTCTTCGAEEAQERVRTRDVPFKNHALRIEGDRFTHCGVCGSDYYSPAQSKMADRLFADARRKAERMMTGDEIRALRQSFQLSQRQFETVLGIGEKTVVRWENGTAVQSKAMDNLLNMLRYEPHSIRLLMRLREAPNGTVAVEDTPEFQRQLHELERFIYARLEATKSVNDDSVADVTRAVMSAYHDLRKNTFPKY